MILLYLINIWSNLFIMTLNLIETQAGESVNSNPEREDKNIYV